MTTSLYRHTPLLFLTAALVLLGSAAQARPAEDGESRTRYAIVVGHNQGDHRTTRLRYAIKDADKVARLLSAIGEVPPERMFVLRSPDADELRSALSRMAELLSGPAGEQAEVLLYYSGHADDTALLLGDTFFPLQELRTWLKQSPAKVRIALIDACHSGALLRDKGGKRIPLDLAISSEGDASGFAIITSSSAGEKSQESEELRGSFFTHFLTSGMRGEADSSGDGRVTLGELYQFAYHRTLNRTYAAGGRGQHPTFDYSLSGSGEVVVSYPARAASRLLFPESAEGDFLLYDPASDTVLAEVEKKAGQTRSLAVPAGTFDLFRRSDSALFRTSIDIPSGTEVSISASQMEPVSRTWLIDKGRTPSVSLAAKGGYQFFWDATIRERSLLPSVLGGVELRVNDLMGRRVTPFVELLVGGGVSSSTSDYIGPLAQTFACFEGGAGVAFSVLTSPFLIELAPEIALYYARRTVDNETIGQSATDNYVTATPLANLLVGWQVVDALSIGLQARAGYLYFLEDGMDRHLGYSEFFLSAMLRL